MKSNELVFSTLVNTIINNKMLRHTVLSKLDKFIYNRVVVDKVSDIHFANIKIFQFLSAILNTVKINLDKGNISPKILLKLINMLTGGEFKITKEQKMDDLQVKFKEKYKQYPPLFIVLSPTQVCNLK